jgi:predicted RNase H-like nuclease (RuvC/YqgF family)
MITLSISYQDFMDLSCEARDELLSTRIIATSSPYVRRLLAPHKVNNNREIIARMGDRITELEIENEKLNKTIEWMHQTIWELMRKTKGLDPGNEDTSKTGIDP